jgi:hypothetical protein
VTFRPTSPATRGAPTPPAAAAAAKDAAVAEQAEDIVAAALAGVAWRDVIVPRTSIRGRMRLLNRAEKAQVRMDVRRDLVERHGITPSPGWETLPEWREERVLRVVTTAVRDPADPGRQLADVDWWATLDDGQLDALWDAYQDLEAQADPLGPNAPPLSEKEVAAMLAAAKKGDADLLMSYGSRKQALFEISLAAALPT